MEHSLFYSHTFMKLPRLVILVISRSFNFIFLVKFSDILEGFLPKVNTDKLRNFVQNLGNKVEEIISQKKPYSTIIHGDLELKNILIREVNKGEICSKSRFPSRGKE